MKTDPSQLLTVGRVGSVYGVRGWVRIHSYTSPPQNIFDYQPWCLLVGRQLQSVEVVDWQWQAKGAVAHLAGYNDRDAAALLTRAEIQVEKSRLPPLQAGEYYWHQLEGLLVISIHQNGRRELGRVSGLMETGANDVLMVRGNDGRERLIPYLPDQVVKSVDLTAGQMLVDWDPDF